MNCLFSITMNKFKIPCVMYIGKLVPSNILYNYVEIIEMLVDSYKIIGKGIEYAEYGYHKGGKINFCNLQKTKGYIELVGDVSGMFGGSNFNGDISNWDVSNVKYMYAMFYKSKFNGDISNWVVTNVTDMEGMFYRSQSDRDISNWDVSNVKIMVNMFSDSQFNGDISKWDISNETNKLHMFYKTKFINVISNWGNRP